MACKCAPFVYTVNTALSNVLTEGVISPGAVIHQVCTKCFLNGDGIVCIGKDAFELDANVVLTPVSGSGIVAVELRQGGVSLPDTKVQAQVGGIITLPINAVVRNDTKESSTITLVNVGVEANISKVSVIAKPIL